MKKLKYQQVFKDTDKSTLLSNSNLYYHSSEYPENIL